MLNLISKLFYINDYLICRELRDAAIRRANNVVNGLPVTLFVFDQASLTVMEHALESDTHTTESRNTHSSVNRERESTAASSPAEHDGIQPSSFASDAPTDSRTRRRDEDGLEDGLTKEVQ